jgi:hypothetical protein
VEMSSVLGREASSYVMGIGRPGQRKPSPATAVTREGKAEAAAGDDDILILLDPIVLLKRQAYG